MEERGKEHVELFKKLVAERRVRPSLTLPLWDLGGFALGEFIGVARYFLTIRSKFGIIFQLINTKYIFVRSAPIYSDISSLHERVLILHNIVCFFAFNLAQNASKD